MKVYQKRNPAANIIRFIVKMNPTREDAEAQINHNIVSYSTLLSGHTENGKPVASALAQALFTARMYYGELFAEYANGEIRPYKYIRD